MKPDVLTRWLGAARRERVLRVLLSDYVLNGASCAFGMFVVSAIVHLLFGAEAAANATVGVIAALAPDLVGPRRGKLVHLVVAPLIGVPLFLALRRGDAADAAPADTEAAFAAADVEILQQNVTAAFDRLIVTLRDALNLSVFLVTHDLDTLHACCDRVAVLADKKVIAVGTIPELIATGHPWIEEYFNGPRGRSAHATHLQGEGA